jgi:MFS family permease
LIKLITDRYPALAFSLYRRYWLASLGSVGGWQIAAVAMGWLVFDLSGSVLDLGILGAALALPGIVMTMVGGVIADRFEKRTVLLMTTWVQVLVLILLACLDALGLISVTQVWLLAAIISTVSGIDGPTRQAFFPHLINRDALLSAVALNSVLWQLTRMVVPAVAGLIIATYSTALVFWLAALGYLIMLIVLLQIRLHLPGIQGSSPLSQIMEGLRFIVVNPLFRNLILLCYASMFFLSAYQQLMPAFADLLGAGPKGFGLLMSASGVGSIVGTVISGAIKPGPRYGRTMLAAAGFSAVMLSAFAVSTMLPSYLLALLFVLFSAAGLSVFLILSATALQFEVPDQLRGRVLGIHTITYSLMPLGALLIGALAEVYGTPVAMLMGLAGYTFIWMGLGASASIRHLEQPDGRSN